MGFVFSVTIGSHFGCSLLTSKFTSKLTQLWTMWKSMNFATVVSSVALRITQSSYSRNSSLISRPSRRKPYHDAWEILRKNLDPFWSCGRGWEGLALLRILCKWWGSDFLCLEPLSILELVYTWVHIESRLVLELIWIADMHYPVVFGEGIITKGSSFTDLPAFVF